MLIYLPRFSGPWSGAAKVGPILTNSFQVERDLDLKEAAGWRRRQLWCLNGLVGEISMIVYDYQTMEPIWLGISVSTLPLRMLLVPAGTVRVEEARLLAPFTMEHILRQPPVLLGEGLTSLSEEDSIYRYFGLPFEMRDTRVLRASEEIPGLAQSWQNIFAGEEALMPARQR